MMADDMDLARQYAGGKSEEAFATLVSRHVNLVYSVAFRQVRDVHLAEEITQTVFVILAQKAGSLGPKTVVPGWLCRTARFASAKALTMQRRRQLREQAAFMQSSSHEADAHVWAQIEPLLDAAMAQLGEKDQNAVALRFFEARSFKDVSAALGTTEAGAKMRVNRALEKLRKFFIARGLTFSTTLMAASISSNSVQAAPAGLAISAMLAATKPAAPAASTATLIKETLKLMTWTKLKTALVIGAVAIVAAGAATVAIHQAKPEAPSSSFKFVGYASPEAAVESMIWMASTGGSLEKIADGMMPEQMDQFRSRMAGKSDDEIKQACIAWGNSLAGYKITQKDIVSTDEVRLHIHANPSSDGLHSGHTILIMKKVGGAWKFDGDAS
jgi:RNA polymerase sigma factor (sigma-70 family)